MRPIVIVIPSSGIELRLGVARGEIILLILASAAGAKQIALVPYAEAVLWWVGLTIAKKMRCMKQIDRRISVAPTMDWTDDR